MSAAHGVLHLVEAINEFLAGGGNSGWMQPQPATPSPVRPQPAKKRRGFNLVEAAIVLGVIGLVIGGIWVAAGEIAFRRGIANTFADTMMIAGRMQSLGRSYWGTSNFNPPNNQPTLQIMGIVPANYIYQGAGQSYTITNFSRSSTLSISNGIAAGTSSYININLVLLPANTCLELLSKIYTALKGQGWKASTSFVQVNTGSGTSTFRFDTDYTMSDFTTTCTGATTGIHTLRAYLYW